MNTEGWWNDYANIVILIRYLADQEYGALDIVQALEKPWHYTEEYRKAMTWNANQAGD